MTFQNLRTVFPRRKKLRHVTFVVANFGHPLRALDHAVAFDFCSQLGGPLFEHVIKKLFRRVRSVNFADRLEQLERKLIAIEWEKIVAAPRQPINHFWPAHLLRTPPSIEITVALQRKAV